MTTPTSFPPCTTGITRNAPWLRSRCATAAALADAVVDTTSGFMISPTGIRSSASSPSSWCSTRQRSTSSRLTMPTSRNDVLTTGSALNPYRVIRSTAADIGSSERTVTMRAVMRSFTTRAIHPTVVRRRPGVRTSALR